MLANVGYTEMTRFHCLLGPDIIIKYLPCSLQIYFIFVTVINEKAIFIPKNETI